MGVDIVAALEAGVQQLVDAGIAATIDPTKLKVPGALVQLVDVDPFDTLTGYTIGARVLLVAADRTDPRSLAKLQELLSLLLTADLQVAGTITGTGVVTPASSPASLPGLAVPITLYTDESE